MRLFNSYKFPFWIEQNLIYTINQIRHRLSFTKVIFNFFKGVYYIIKYIQISRIICKAVIFDNIFDNLIPPRSLKWYANYEEYVGV